MQTWFSCKVKYYKIDEHGKQVRMSESYLVEAINFTEAETRIYEMMEQYGNSDIVVSGISKTNLAEIVDADDGQFWYKAKIGWEDVDEKSGRISRVSQYYLVAANNVMDTCERLDTALSAMMADYEINAVSLSPILDVFPLFIEEEEGAVPNHLRPLADEECQQTNLAEEDAEPAEE